MKHSLIARRNGLNTGHIGEELLILNLEKDSFFSLNQAASRIWQLLESPTTINDLIEALLVEYEVDPAICRREVKDFIDNLRIRQMLEDTAAG
jgi:hypothetical protein